MRSWEFPLELDSAASAPLFLQIARAISEEIRRGRLRPGALLPGTRALAQTLSVHRNTVVAAYAELRAEGWIESTAATCTAVSRALPLVLPRRFADGASSVPALPGFDLGK